jgi:aarF domain-containing kinase
MDMKSLERISHSWGIEDVNLFASATLQRPYNPTKVLHLERVSVEDIYQMQVSAKEKITKFLKDTKKIPLELIFIERNLTLVRSNNKHLGSPVNRINIMANWAVAGLGVADHQKRANVMPILHYCLFQAQLMLISIGFHTTRMWQILVRLATGKREGGFEELIDKQMMATMQSQLGMKVNAEAFSG